MRGIILGLWVWFIVLVVTTDGIFCNKSIKGKEYKLSNNGKQEQFEINLLNNQVPISQLKHTFTVNTHKNVLRSVSCEFMFKLILITNNRPTETRKKTCLLEQTLEYSRPSLQLAVWLELWLIWLEGLRWRGRRVWRGNLTMISLFQLLGVINCLFLAIFKKRKCVFQGSRN